MKQALVKGKKTSKLVQIDSKSALKLLIKAHTILGTTALETKTGITANMLRKHDISFITACYQSCSKCLINILVMGNIYRNKK